MYVSNTILIILSTLRYFRDFLALDLYFSKYEGWTKDFHKATKLRNKDIESIKNLLMNESINNNIINPYLVEIDSNGKINKLREKIRYLGPKLESQYNV